MTNQQPLERLVAGWMAQEAPAAGDGATVDAILAVRDPFRVVGIPEWFSSGVDRNTRVVRIRHLKIHAEALGGLHPIEKLEGDERDLRRYGLAWCRRTRGEHAAHGDHGRAQQTRGALCKALSHRCGLG